VFTNIVTVVDVVPKNREHAIRELAYQLWEGRGHQHGHAIEDWLDAERLLLAATENAPPPVKVPNPPEGEVDEVASEEPKVASRDAPGG
jgi:hypothetical protein